MSEPGEQAERESIAQHARSRTDHLEQEAARLHREMLEIAESVRRSHEKTAETMEKLAATGSAEYTARRRQAAEFSRRLAKQEASQIAALKSRGSREPGRGSGDQPDGNPS
jgi:hypothetical protein